MTSEIYTKSMAITMAKKIMELQKYGVAFEISIVHGIDKEEVIKLSWDQDVLREAWYAEEMA